jgi:hypothetical protein
VSNSSERLKCHASTIIENKQNDHDWERIYSNWTMIKLVESGRTLWKIWLMTWSLNVFLAKRWVKIWTDECYLYFTVCSRAGRFFLIHPLLPFLDRFSESVHEEQNIDNYMDYQGDKWNVLSMQLPSQRLIESPGKN